MDEAARATTGTSIRRAWMIPPLALASAAWAAAMRLLPAAKTDAHAAFAIADLACRLTHGQRRCLPRSLMVWWWLKARGQPAELILGARRVADGLDGHAWIEMNGTPLGDRPEGVAPFTVFLRFA